MGQVVPNARYSWFCFVRFSYFVIVPLLSVKHDRNYTKEETRKHTKAFRA